MTTRTIPKPTTEQPVVAKRWRNMGLTSYGCFHGKGTFATAEEAKAVTEKCQADLIAMGGYAAGFVLVCQEGEVPVEDIVATFQIPVE